MRHTFFLGRAVGLGTRLLAWLRLAVLCTLNWERDFPCMWHKTYTCTIQTMVEAGSVATNGESSSDSVSTQECTKLHLRASIFPKIIWGACPQTPLGSAAYAPSRFVAGWLRPRKELPSKIFWIRPCCLWCNFPSQKYPLYSNSRTDCDGYHNLNRRHWGPQQLLLSFLLLRHWDRLCDKPFDRKQPFHPTGCHSGSCGSSDSSVEYCYCGNPCYYYTEEEEREGWKTPALEVAKTH